MNPRFRQSWRVMMLHGPTGIGLRHSPTFFRHQMSYKVWNSFKWANTRSGTISRRKCKALCSFLSLVSDQRLTLHFTVSILMKTMTFATRNYSSRVADAIGYFWDYAEELGIAERIMLVIGSDFGRTNFYNDGNGKDHWPVGSYIIMEKNAPWGNRVVGVTDDLHFAQRIDPTTLKESRDGVLITPAHVHQAVQEYLGLDQYARDIGLSLPGSRVVTAVLMPPYRRWAHDEASPS